MSAIKLVDQPSRKSGGKCPICRQPSEPGDRPFCSRRCADIDLGRWLGGGYAIAGGADGSDEDGDDALARHAAASGREDTTDEDE